MLILSSLIFYVVLVAQNVAIALICELFLMYCLNARM